MPSGLPSAVALFDKKKVAFFSIDTDVIQGLGFKFSEGALGALALQLPDWLSIKQTEVVEKEVLAHRMEPVSKVNDNLKSAISNMQRHSGIDFSAVISLLDSLDPAKVTAQKFSNEFRKFVSNLDGDVLKIAGQALAKQIFDQYFDRLAPFEVRETKKHEFPDAAALFILENHAKEIGKQGILISKDSGWADFANQSDWLYCVNSLDEFVGLFKSTGTVATQVETKVASELANPTSYLSGIISNAVNSHVSEASWYVDDVWTGICDRIEVEVDCPHYLSHTVDLNAVGAWIADHDPTICTIEIKVKIYVSVDVRVEFYRYDVVDGDEFRIGSADVSRDREIEINAFITLRGDLVQNPIDSLSPSVDIAGGEYWVDVGEVEPDYGEYDRY